MGTVVSGLPFPTPEDETLVLVLLVSSEREI